jgi:hypothetical protein
MSLEFEVYDADAVGAAAEELRQRGFTLLHDRREEPWGQRWLGFNPEKARSSGSRSRPRCMTDPMTNHRRALESPRRWPLVGRRRQRLAMRELWSGSAEACRRTPRPVDGLFDREARGPADHDRRHAEGDTWRMLPLR